ncbi:MAG: SnoaL-like domain-containing protein [Pseudomonadota bacterium]
MPTPQELMQLGQTLIDHCKSNRETELQDNYYTADAISVEAMAMPTGSAEAPGLDAIKAKNEWWYGAHELHAMTVEGPFVHGSDRFSVIFDIDVTQKESGERMQMREIATYHVNQDNKITREEFAYAVGE